MPILSTKAEALRELYDRFEPSLRKEFRTPAKFVRGHGNAEAEIVLVGEAPGLDEDRQGIPFIGRAGQLLNKWLGTIGLVREDVFITNVVKFHPMKNPATPDVRGNDRPPKPVEIAACWPVLQQEIHIIRPKVIVTLGNPSTKTLLNTKESITALHGKFVPFPAEPSVQVFPMFHPAATFHNPTLIPLIEKDLQALKLAL